MLPPKIRRYSKRGALQDLLLKACVPVNNNASIPILAAHLNCTPQTIYYWIEQGKIPPAKAMLIVALGPKLGVAPLVKIEEFLPFVFRIV